MKWIIFLVIVLVGCGGKPNSPTTASTCDPADRAIIEKEWLTQKDEPRRHNLYPDESWWHSCVSIEKIDLVETTDKGRFYKVIWNGEIYWDAMPPNPGMGDGSSSSQLNGVRFNGIKDINEAIKGAIQEAKGVDIRGVPLPTTKTVPGGRKSSGMHSSKMYIRDGRIDFIQVECGPQIK